MHSCSSITNSCWYISELFDIEKKISIPIHLSAFKSFLLLCSIVFMAASALMIQSEADLKNVKITFPQEKSLSVVKKENIAFYDLQCF